MKYIKAEVLRSFMVDALVKNKVKKDHAEICAETLIMADILGIDSHGINRLKPHYIDFINAGRVNPEAEFSIIKDGPTTTVIDGNNGLGLVIAKRAMQITLDKAAKFGMGMTVVRNSNHYGIAGYYGLMAAERNMICITGTNARPAVAPTFGVEGMFGTNPLTFVMPTDEEFPFFLDCATSTGQRGKVEVYARIGKETPDGWVVNNEGKCMNDSARILKDLISGDAAFLTLGGAGEDTSGYKGYGYATVVEILSSALQAGAFLKGLEGIENGAKTPYKIGHFFIAIDVSAFIDVDEFKKTTGTILRQLRASKKMPGAERIYTAGEKEAENKAIRMKDGIPVNNDLMRELKFLADTYSISGYSFLD